MGFRSPFSISKNICIKVINYVRNVRYQIIYKYFKHKYSEKKSKSKFKLSTNIHSHLYLIENFIYKDENWDYIKNIHKLFWYKSIGLNKPVFDNDCINTKISVQNDKSLLIKSSGILDDWIYYYLNEKICGNYAFELNVVLHSVFTEFQIAFHHQSIFERYRFRVVDNEVLVFEVIHGGYFFTNLFSVPFYFELNKLYIIKLIIKKGNYVFIANNEVILSIIEKGCLLPSGGVAIILWDVNESSNIDITIKNLSISKIY
jgi:hypothetical protein